jgi:hypothetical protein
MTEDKAMLHFYKKVFNEDLGERTYCTGKTETGNEYEVGKAPSGRFFCNTLKPYAGKHIYVFDTITQAVRFANSIEDMMHKA